MHSSVATVLVDRYNGAPPARAPRDVTDIVDDLTDIVWARWPEASPFEILADMARNFEATKGMAPKVLASGARTILAGYNAARAGQPVHVVPSDNPDALGEALEILAGADVVAIDLETTGLDCRADQIVTMQVAKGLTAHDAETFIIAWPPAEPAWVAQFLAMVHPLDDAGEEQQAKQRTQVFHNAEFDLAFLTAKLPAFKAAGIFDTMWAEAVLRSQDTSKGCGLKAVAEHYLGRTMDKGDVRLSFKAGQALTAEQLQYAAADAYTTLDLWPILRRRLEASGKLLVAADRFARAVDAAGKKAAAA